MPAAQREYFSEHAITRVETALCRIIAEIDALCAHDDADVVVSRLLKKFDVVTGLSAWSDPLTHQLTGPLPRLRADPSAIVRGRASPRCRRACSSPRRSWRRIATSLAGAAPCTCSPWARRRRRWRPRLRRVAPGRDRDGLGRSARTGPAHWPPAMTFVDGGHPLPTAGSVDGGRRALALAGGVPPPTSGSSCCCRAAPSALMAVPAAASRSTTSSGRRAAADAAAPTSTRSTPCASICRRVKGGWLAAACRGAIVTLAISDVVGDDLERDRVGAERAGRDRRGPMRSRRSTAFGGDAPIRRGRLRVWRAPARAGALAETPKPGDTRWRAPDGARDRRPPRRRWRAPPTPRAALGYDVVVIDAPVTGEARDAAARLVATRSRGRRPPAGAAGA